MARDGSDEAWLFTLKVKKSGALEPIEKNHKLTCTTGGNKYYSMKHLADCINREISEYRRSLPNTEPLGFGRGGTLNTPNLKYNEIYNTYSVTNDVGTQFYVRLALHWRLASRFGFRNDQFPLKPKSTETVVSTSNPVKEITTNSIQTLYVYSDLIVPQLIGDVRASLLRIVPVIDDPSGVTNVEFHRLHYFPLLKQSFQYVQVDIRDDTGDIVPFASYGRVVCVIHIRRKKNY